MAWLAGVRGSNSSPGAGSAARSVAGNASARMTSAALTEPDRDERDIVPNGFAELVDGVDDRMYLPLYV